MYKTNKLVILLAVLISLIEGSQAKADFCQWALSLTGRANFSHFDPFAFQPTLDPLPLAFLTANTDYSIFAPVFEVFSRSGGRWIPRENKIAVLFSDGREFDFEFASVKTNEGQQKKVLSITFTHEPLAQHGTYFEKFQRSLEKERAKSPDFIASFESNTTVNSSLFLYEGTRQKENLDFIKLFFKKVTFRSPTYNKEVKPNKVRFNRFG